MTQEIIELHDYTNRGPLFPQSLYSRWWHLHLFFPRATLSLKEVSVPLINVIMILIVVGVLLWLVNRFIPMQATIKSILNGVVVIAVVLWLLDVFGLFSSFSHIRVGS